MSLAIDTTSIHSPNYDERPVPPSALVIHTGEGSKESDLHELTDDRRPPLDRVSAHFYVDRTGHIYQLVSPLKRAWHAGRSSYAGKTSWNDFAIGIETQHVKGQDWPAPQKLAITALAAVLIAQYHIPQNMVVAHRWIAAPLGRRSDPTDWPDPAFKAWIAGLYAPPPPPIVLPTTRYRTRGIPVYERRDCTGKIAIFLNEIEIKEIYPDGIGHEANGAGFVRLTELERL